jgi:hypothetical protein
VEKDDAVVGGILRTGHRVIQWILAIVISVDENKGPPMN